MSKGTPGNPVGSRRTGFQNRHPDSECPVSEVEWKWFIIGPALRNRGSQGWKWQVPAIFSIRPCPTRLGRQEYRTFVCAQDQPGSVIMRKNSENILHVWKFCLPLHHDNTGKKCFRPQLSGWCHSSVGRAKDWKSLCRWFDSRWYHKENQRLTAM